MHATRFPVRDGLTLAADVGGNPDNPPAILLHGGGQTRYSWGETAEALADNGFYAIALDLRGHGESDWSRGGDYTIDQYVEDLCDICAAIGRPAALIGASLGGVTALLAAGERSSRIASALILVDIAPRVNHAEAEKILQFMRSSPNGFASLDEAADAVAAYLPHRPRPTDTTGLMKNLRPNDDGQLVWHWDPKFVERASALQIDAHTRLAAAARQISVPALLIRGGKSELVTDESVRDFLDLVPSAEYALIEGAHHMVAGDRNTAFSAAVIDFMQRRVDHGSSGHYD